MTDAEDEAFEVDPTDFFDSLWRNDGLVLCEARTALSAEEHAYVMTRKDRSVPPLVEAANGAVPEVWCPMWRDHSSAHLALIGWGDHRDEDEGFMGLFMEWGPTAREPRWIGRRAICNEHVQHEGDEWACYLHLGHDEEHRRSVEVEDLGLDFSVDPEDFDVEETNKWVNSKIVETYLAGTTSWQSSGG